MESVSLVLISSYILQYQLTTWPVLWFMLAMIVRKYLNVLMKLARISLAGLVYIEWFLHILASQQYNLVEIIPSRVLLLSEDYLPWKPEYLEQQILLWT